MANITSCYITSCCKLLQTKCYISNTGLLESYYDLLLAKMNQNILLTSLWWLISDYNVGNIKTLNKGADL